MNLVMAAFCLFSVWCVALLSAGDVLIDFRALRRLRQRLKANLRYGTVVRGDGPHGALATHTLEQRTRPLDGPAPALGFWDHSWSSELHGGEVKLSDGGLERLKAGELVEVWPDSAAQAKEAQVNARAFSTLWAEAQGAKGGLRSVFSRLGVGQQVWLSGDGDRLVLSAIDPAQWCSRRMGLCLAFVALCLVWVGAGTGLALFVGEPWGWGSRAGAVVLIALFLGLTPLCVKVRELCKTPEKAALMGTATDPVSEAGLASAPVRT